MTYRWAIALWAILCFSFSSLAATTIVWTGAGDGKTFASAANWSPALAPDSTTDCIIPAGAGTIVFGGVPTLRSLTVARDITLNSCSYPTITNGLTLQNGITVTLDEPTGCVGLAFAGGTQSISGNGSIFLRNSGIDNPSSLVVISSGDVRIESGVTLRVGIGSGKMLIGVNTGARLTNAGSISLPTSKPLSIVGPGEFINEGSIQATASRIEFLTNTWTNSGVVALNNGTLMLGGTYSAWGTVTRSGSCLIELAGRYLSNQILASSATGDLALAGVELVNATIAAADGARVLSKNTSTLDACTIMSDVDLNCATWVIRNSLTLNAKLTVRSGIACADSIRFQGSAQSLSGTGSIQVVNTATFRAAVEAGCDATFSSTIPIQFDSSGGLSASFVATIGAGGTLRCRTPLTLAGGTLSITGAGQFVNETALSMPNGGTMTIGGTPWENTGSISATNATVTLTGGYSSFSNFTRSGGSLTLSGACSAPMIETDAALGSLLLKDFAGLGTTLLPSNGNTISIRENVTLVGATINGRIPIEQCGTLTIQSGLTLNAASELVSARVQPACTGDAIRFDGGLQSVSGTGQITFQTADDNALHIVNNATVTIGTGVTLQTTLPSGAAIVMTIDPGCTLINQGSLNGASANSTITIQGGGAFSNAGVINITQGSLKIASGTWTSPGTMNLGAGATLQIQGSPSWISNLNNSGGTFQVVGTSSGAVLETNPQLGDVWLDSVDLTATTLRTSGGAQFFLSGYNTFRSCIIDGHVSIRNGARVKVFSNLEVRADAVLGMWTTSNQNRPELSFESGDQSITGEGVISVSYGVIVVQNNASLLLTSDVAIETAGEGNTRECTIALSGNARFVNEGTLKGSLSNNSLRGSCSGLATFENRGLIDVLAGQFWINWGFYMPSSTPKWINTGTVRVADASEVAIRTSFETLGTIDRTLGTLRVAGICTGLSFDAGATGGDVHLTEITFTDCSLLGAPGRQPIFEEATTLVHCQITGVARFATCSDIYVNGGLTLNAAALEFSPNGNCSNTTIVHFSGGAQALLGTGTVALTEGALLAESPLTIGPDVAITTPAIGSPNVPIGVNTATGQSITNFGTISMSVPGRQLTLGSTDGTFINSGQIHALAGSIWIAGLSGSLGAVDVTPGATLTVNGTYSIDSPLSLGAGSALNLRGAWTNNSTISSSGSTVTLEGTWTNNGLISVTGGALNVTGVWTNAGTISALDSAVKFAGTPVQEGTLQLVNSPRTYSGTYSGALVIANAATGDITLNAATLVGTTLRTEGGAKFLLRGSSNTLSNCTVQSDLTLDQCNSLTIVDTLTLTNGARLMLDGCSTTPITFSGASTSILGNGQLVVRGTTGGVTFQNLGTSTVTFGAGILLSLPADASPSTLTFSSFKGGGKFVLQGVLLLERPFATTAIQGGLQNQGLIDLRAGTLSVSNMMGSIGLLNVAPGASLALDGAYTIDRDLAFSSGGLLSLAGTWTNTASISVQGAPFTLGGTWTNSGSFHVSNSFWTIGGTYATLGNYTSSGNSLAYAGTYPGSALIADASTGDILLLNLNLKNARLEARDTARLVVGAGATLGLDNCTIASDLTFNSCSGASISNGLALESASLILKNRTCTKASLVFTGPEQTIAGTGAIQLADPASVADIQVASTCLKVNIGAGVSVICKPPTGSANAAISVTTGRTLINRGLISCQSPITLTISGTGTFSNEGTVESTAGTVSVNPTTLSNYTSATSTLSGGTWRAENGSLTLGSRSIAQIAANTSVRLRGAAISTPTLSQLNRNNGTLSLQSRTLTTAAAFTNAGTLALGPGAVIDTAAGMVCAPSSALRLNLGAAPTASIRAGVSLTLAGTLSVGVESGPLPAEGSAVAAFGSANAISGAFAGACFDSNPESLGVTPIINAPAGVPPKATLDLLFSVAGSTTPNITQQPEPTVAAPDAQFEVVAAPGTVQYQWRRNLTPLDDGPTPQGSTISGAKTALLTILSARAADAGTYDCVVSNACGSMVSHGAALTVCPADLNGDGMVDDADFIIFVAAYNVLDCADPAMADGCPSDLDSSGSVDDADFVIFLDAYNQLLCA